MIEFVIKKVVKTRDFLNGMFTKTLSLNLINFVLVSSPLELT